VVATCIFNLHEDHVAGALGIQTEQVHELPIFIRGINVRTPHVFAFGALAELLAVLELEEDAWLLNAQLSIHRMIVLREHWRYGVLLWWWISNTSTFASEHLTNDIYSFGLNTLRPKRWILHKHVVLFINFLHCWRNLRFRVYHWHFSNPAVLHSYQELVEVVALIGHKAYLINFIALSIEVALTS